VQQDNKPCAFEKAPGRGCSFHTNANWSRPPQHPAPSDRRMRMQASGPPVQSDTERGREGFPGPPLSRSTRSSVAVWSGGHCLHNRWHQCIQTQAVQPVFIAAGGVQVCPSQKIPLWFACLEYFPDCTCRGTCAWLPAQNTQQKYGPVGLPAA